MLSKRYVRRILKNLPVIMLLGASSPSGLPRAHAQEDTGVKIALTLTPSKPEKDSDKKSELPSQSAPKKADSGSTSPALPQEFVLRAFQLMSDKSAPKATGKEIAPNATQMGELALEQAPAPPVKPKQLESETAPKKPESNATEVSRKPAESSQKPSDIKPLKINEPKAKGIRNESDNEDATGAECPGGADGVKVLPNMPDDLPLQEGEHPYDAPAAESTSNKPDRPASTQPLSLNSDQLRLRNEINQLLRYYMQYPETIARRSPWAVMHAILPYGVEAELSAGNRRVNAIGWMSYNGLCKTQRIFQPTKTGFRTNLGPGVQGHEGQFLAVLAQSKVSPAYPIKVGTRTYTVNDLVRYEMASCREKSELTFKLIALSYYLEPDQRWRDNQGGTWSLEKLVSEELDQPIVGAACGGTHRLMGLTFSLLQRKQAGLPIDGHWNRSEQFLNEFVAYAFSLQNPDGSFSTDWFEARANAPEVERKVQTTGHVLEWLIYTLPDDQLQSPPVQKAIRFLLSTIGAEPGRDWPIGPRGHSLRALALYNQRVFGAQPGKLKQYIADLSSESKQR